MTKPFLRTGVSNELGGALRKKPLGIQGWEDLWPCEGMVGEKEGWNQTPDTYLAKGRPQGKQHVVLTALSTPGNIQFSQTAPAVGQEEDKAHLNSRKYGLQAGLKM